MFLNLKTTIVAAVITAGAPSTAKAAMVNLLIRPAAGVDLTQLLPQTSYSFEIVGMSDAPGFTATDFNALLYYEAGFARTTDLTLSKLVELPVAGVDFTTSPVVGTFSISTSNLGTAQFYLQGPLIGPTTIAFFQSNRLTVTAVPEPGAFVAVAAVGLFIRRRRVCRR